MKLIQPFIFYRQEVDGIFKLVPLWLQFDREDIAGRHSFVKLTNWDRVEMTTVNVNGEDLIMPLVGTIQQHPDDVELSIPFGDGILKTFAPSTLDLPEALKMLSFQPVA